MMVLTMEVMVIATPAVQLWDPAAEMILVKAVQEKTLLIALMIAQPAQPARPSNAEILMLASAPMAPKLAETAETGAIAEEI